MSAATAASPWKNRRRRIFQSVFQTDVSGPATSYTHHDPFAFGSGAATATSDQQVIYDGAWHTVTARISLPPSATAEELFETLAPDSQQQSSSGEDVEFNQALDLLVHAPTVLPWATPRTDDIMAWHAQQVRAHFSHHVIPILTACVGEQQQQQQQQGDRNEPNMVVVMTSIKTLQAALGLYSHGLGLLMRGLSPAAASDSSTSSSGGAVGEAELVEARFRRDIHALVAISASEGLMASLRIVLVRLIGTVLGIPSADGGQRTGESQRPTARARPVPPTENDFLALAARRRLHELVEQLYNVGLAGERFQVLFAEIMDWMMSNFVSGAYGGVWAAASDARTFAAATDTISRNPAALSSTSPCILSLSDWIENHFARLSVEVLSRLSPSSSSPPVTLSDVKTYQSLALGRLAALRIAELFDIALAWPSSRGALDDLRATITTAPRRQQLTASFSRALQARLLHPGCSTLDILHTYIAIIHTLHALDHSKVMLGHVEPSLQLYLCQREDAIRIVVAGLLASPDEVRAARKATEAFKRQGERRQKDGDAGSSSRWKRAEGSGAALFATPAARSGRSTRTPGTRRLREATPESGSQSRTTTPRGDRDRDRPSAGPTKLVELALLLNDPSQTRRAQPADDEGLDWDDMSWVPDPVDAGANYKRPKSEDVIGTLISALGSEDVFIKEFTAVIAERLLGDPNRFDQELRLLELLKQRFGEAALQNCDVMIKDVLDSRRLDTVIRRMRQLQDHGRFEQQQQQQQQQQAPLMRTPAGPMAAYNNNNNRKKDEAEVAETQYHACILSRLFWPALDHEHFLLPPPIVDKQKQYEKAYKSLKSGRKLTWLNQLGQTRVELELRDRTVTVDCSTAEATVIYAFHDADAGEDAPPARRSADELYNQLQMDEDLIAAALSFWASKGVLRRAQQGEYVVAETLAAPGGGSWEQQQGTAGVPSDKNANNNNNNNNGKAPRRAGKTAGGGGGAGGGDAKEQERRAMYWQYIRGMLTNSSASMPLAQMAMMMKMLIADGFPWSNEELQEFLGEKIAGGEMEVVGGKYKLVKK
ncbi:hypothetical protein B0T17DRAFT_499240 [Bombardia bombarda]|uniref:Anaphase-promoting complex subunit 2 n=1 Tax=Bombardia bombarda TaxID=252184 RepID=A0AA39TUQ4_9PEZI|nr:hypothetical protein B0T17DRAFT_499240 [Bombardia bombarda]